MKYLLLTTIAAVVLVGCGESQQSAPAPEAKPVEPVAEAPQAELPTWHSFDDIVMSARGGKIEAVKQHLAAGADVNATASTGWTALHQAAMFGHKKIVELLIAKGADVNAENNLHATPLDLAEDEIADLLRKHGGKTGDWLNADKSIHKAASAGHIEAVKQHLAAGADVNAKADGRMSPLHKAAWGGHKEIAELLIAEGVDVNAKDEWGATPLHSAATKEIAELFIANGADVNAKTKRGETPLDLAEDEIADLLRKHGGKTGAELEAAGKPAEPVAEAAQPEPPTAKTPLWKAAMFGEIEPAKQAIADGADVNAKGERGLTPLHFAVVAALDSGDNKVIELLIANGADVNAKDDSGLTPLDSVKRLSEVAAITKKLRAIQGKTDDIPVADLLRKHGGKTGEELKAEGK